MVSLRRIAFDWKNQFLDKLKENGTNTLALNIVFAHGPRIPPVAGDVIHPGADLGKTAARDPPGDGRRTRSYKNTGRIADDMVGDLRGKIVGLQHRLE